jgi:hypothetical protein
MGLDAAQMCGSFEFEVKLALLRKFTQKMCFSSPKEDI